MNSYQIIKKLGTGAAGKVYLAKDKSSNQQYALKEIDVDSKDILNQTLKEIETMKKLQHPYIVRYYKSFQENNKLYILMEYIDGGDLSTFIADRKNRYMTEDAILKIFIQITVALRYIHERRIVHRDLKPQNIFLTRVGVVKIGDFGVSKALENTSQLLESKVGTPYYLSPEIWNNDPYNSQTDIWSLGCILYELCMLKKPFKASNINQLIVQIFGAGYEKIPDRYSDDLRNLVASMLEQDPKCRPTAANILTIPFITQRMEAMVLENENQLQNVNIIKPPIRGKSARAFRPKKKKIIRKKKNLPTLIDSEMELPLPDILPKWAQKNSRQAKTQPVSNPNKSNSTEEESMYENDWDYGEVEAETEAEPESEFDADNDMESETEWDELKKSTKILQLSLSLSCHSDDLNIPDSPEEAQKEADEIEERLRKQLGDDLFEELKLHINNEYSKGSRNYVCHMEEEYPKEVSEIRRLLLLEQFAEDI